MDPKVIREQAVREAKISLILDAARKVFSERGFFEARLEDIAAAAGFSKAALYTYYVDKEEIFLSLAIRDMESLYTQLASRVDPEIGFFKNLEAALDTLFTFFGDHFALFLSVSNFQAACRMHKEKLSEKHQLLVSELPCKFRQIIEQQVELLQHARRRNEIDSDLEDMQIANYIGALVRGVIFQWQLHGKMGNVKSEIAQLIKFIAHGLGCPRQAEAPVFTPVQS